MSMVMRTALGTVAGGSLLFAAGMGLANAQPAPADTDNNKIDVALGTITTVDGVDVAAAEQIAGLVCGDEVTNAELTEVQRGDTAEVTCTSAKGNQVITFTQTDQDRPGFAPAQHGPIEQGPTDGAQNNAPGGPAGTPQLEGTGPAAN